MLIVVIGIMPKKVIYGDARLATDMDLSKSGFFPDKKSPYKHPPILIGKMFKGRYKKQFIYFAGQQFLILYAPTRSGKGGDCYPQLRKLSRKYGHTGYQT